MTESLRAGIPGGARVEMLKLTIGPGAGLLSGIPGCSCSDRERVNHDKYLPSLISRLFSAWIAPAPPESGAGISRSVPELTVDLFSPAPYRGERHRPVHRGRADKQEVASPGHGRPLSLLVR